MSGLPPILPTYKIPRNNVKKGGLIECLSVSALIIVPVVLIFLFFVSIYIGSIYLHNHVQSETMEKALLTGHPGTHNEIKKWSMTHLGGIDITRLGPPAVISTHPTEEIFETKTDATVLIDVLDTIEEATEENI